MYSITFYCIFPTSIFMIFLCSLIYLVSMWFWWLTVSVIDYFMFVTDVADFSVCYSVTDVSDLYFITFSLKRCILFWCHFFTFTQDYLTVSYMKFVLVIVIYLVWYVFRFLILYFFKVLSSLKHFYSLWHHIISYIPYIFTH